MENRQSMHNFFTKSQKYPKSKNSIFLTFSFSFSHSKNIFHNNQIARILQKSRIVLVDNIERDCNTLIILGQLNVVVISNSNLKYNCINSAIMKFQGKTFALGEPLSSLTFHLPWYDEGRSIVNPGSASQNSIVFDPIRWLSKYFKINSNVERVFNIISSLIRKSGWKMKVNSPPSPGRSSSSTCLQLANKDRINPQTPNSDLPCACWFRLYESFIWKINKHKEFSNREKLSKYFEALNFFSATHSCATLTSHDGISIFSRILNIWNLS